MLEIPLFHCSTRMFAVTAKKLSTRWLGITFFAILLSASIILPGCASGPGEFLSGLFGGDKQSAESDSGKTKVADNARSRLTPPDDKPGYVRIVSNPPPYGQTVAEKGKVLNPFIRKRTPIADATQDPFLNRFAELDSQLEKARSDQRTTPRQEIALTSKQSANPFEQFKQVSNNAGRSAQPPGNDSNVREKLPFPPKARIDQQLATINSRKSASPPTPRTKKPTAEELAAALLQNELQKSANSAPAANRSFAQRDLFSEDGQKAVESAQPLDGGLFGDRTADRFPDSAAVVDSLLPSPTSHESLHEMIVDSRTIAPRFHLEEEVYVTNLSPSPEVSKDSRSASGQPGEFQQTGHARPVHEGTLRDSDLVRVSANQGGLVRLERPVGLSPVKTADNVVATPAPILLAPNQGAEAAAAAVPAAPEPSAIESSSTESVSFPVEATSTLEPVEWDDASSSEAESTGKPISFWLSVIAGAVGLLVWRRIRSRRALAR